MEEDARKTGGDESAIENRIRHSFSKLGYAQLNAIECTARGDELLLSGELDSFYLKQVAQGVLLRRLPGMVVIDNQLEVMSDQTRTTTGD